MRLTSFTDFAVARPNAAGGRTGRSFATNEIAAEFGISRNHLAKVVRDLADSGFHQTQRGVGGGFTLARSRASRLRSAKWCARWKGRRWSNAFARTAAIAC
jgi:Rrf2 family nitric oxide-sensitive transcriptional repressor